MLRIEAPTFDLSSGIFKWTFVKEGSKLHGTACIREENEKGRYLYIRLHSYTLMRSIPKL